MPAYPFCRRAGENTERLEPSPLPGFSMMQLSTGILEMHDECIRKYQIVYQQIFEIDTRPARDRRRTAYFAKQTTYFLWQKDNELRLISEVPGRPRSHD